MNAPCHASIWSQFLPYLGAGEIFMEFKGFFTFTISISIRCILDVLITEKKI